MESPCKNCAVADQCQPYGNEYMAADGVFIKEMTIPFAGTCVPQHSHEYAHTSFVARGAVSVEGKVYAAPAPIFIPAHKKHRFVALVDDTLILCIHNVSRSGAVEVHEEHQLTAEV